MPLRDQEIASGAIAVRKVRTGPDLTEGSASFIAGSLVSRVPGPTPQQPGSGLPR
jgi:hypothetical protein